jgi:ATPase involved in DNA repair
VRLGSRNERAQRTAQHLADVLNGSQTGQVRLGLERHVLRQILNTVLANANRQLERMTGRYRLRVTERDAASTQSLDLDVEDAQAGLALRKVSTLSGGEGFQASLALALGLSEAAERTSGAVELGALFIDEGFGSLDQDALSKVTQVLRRLPEAQNRMVGVITHVDALKDRLDAQLLVSRTEAGSRVEHRVG